MRTIFAIMLFLPSLFAGAACGADPVITFSFSGVCNGQHIAMTGINIKNITRNCDTTLSWPDTTLTLNIMGTDEYYFSENDLQVFQNVPNPVEENATVKIHAPERGLYKIQIIEFSGKIVISLNAELQKGDHRFLFTPGTSQQYLLTVACKTGSKSIKILSDFTHPHAGCRLTEIGEPSGEPVFKNSKPSGKFTFNAGDSLRFTGNFNGLFAILLDAPATNRSYLFNSISIPPAVTTSDITYIHE
ncbi:MAG: T9SS type A sorting domain-containing protein, partial [Bacteroidota bacterium]